MPNPPQIRPLGGTLSATEALGIDLSKPLSREPTFAWVAHAFSEHPVLVFRDQELGAADLAAFGRQFGTPRKHALIKYRHADHPDVSWLTNVEEDGKVDWYGVKRATDWHTDSTFEDHLPLLAILHAKQVPASKGGTMFADMAAAYAALPEPRKQQLTSLTGLHSRSTGPAGHKAVWRRQRRDREKTYEEVRMARRHAASGDRPADPVRQSDAHARVRGHASRSRLGIDRGTDRARDTGSFRVLPSLAGRRRADVG